MKSYFVNQIDYIVSQYISHYVDNSSAHPLHVLDEEQQVIYPVNGVADSGIAPWQQDFFAWAVGHAAEQGVPHADQLLNWLVSFQIGMLTSADTGATSGFCWEVASAYALQIRDGRGSPQYTSLDHVYQSTFPQVAGLACASQEMANALSISGDQLQAGQMTGYSSSPTGFPSNLQIAVAAAADSGASKGQDAWRVFAARTVKPDYSNFPNFAVIPRSLN